MLSLRGGRAAAAPPCQRVGSGRITWAQASYPAVHDILTNPAYAGAFVFGRTRTEKHLDAAGRLITRARLLPREQWAVLIPDHHPGYISWETVRGQHRPAARELAAAARARRRRRRGKGAALLQGLLRCGRCGRVMQTGYSGTSRATAPATCAPRANQLYADRARLPVHRRRPGWRR